MSSGDWELVSILFPLFFFVFRQTIFEAIYIYYLVPLWILSYVIPMVKNKAGRKAITEDIFKHCILGKKDELKRLCTTFEVNINEKYQGETALHVAIEANHLHIVRYILQTFGKKVDLKVKNAKELTPLDLAIQKQQSKIASELLSCKHVDPELSSVILAVQTDQVDIARTISQIRCRVRLSNRCLQT